MLFCYGGIARISAFGAHREMQKHATRLLELISWCTKDKDVHERDKEKQLPASNDHLRQAKLFSLLRNCPKSLLQSVYLWLKYPSSAHFLKIIFNSAKIC